MNTPETTLPFSLKVFLFFAAAGFALAAAILIISVTSAATSTGSAPALAVSMVAGPNTGVVGPGGQRWFRLKLDQQAEQSLTLIFTPDDGQRVRQVNMQIFDENQVPMFYLGDASGMANLGAGQMVSRDNNPVTGELFWNGWLPGQKEYYIQVANGSDAPVDYWLFADNVINYPLGQPAPPPMPVVAAAPVESAPAVPAAPAPVVNDAGNPLPLPSGGTHSVLKAGATHWYSFSHNDPANPDQFQNMNMTLFFTPGDGNRQEQVNFKLYPAGAVAQWWQGQTDQPINFGAGMLVSRDGDGLTGERFWSGTVIRGDIYLLAVENGSAVDIDYWLFDADIERLQPTP
ncbi:MAG: hypothetical protein HC875_31675 [Anaerolineales bacterium]|nr:hypothetical protein [Anaerolineales bacterium]